MTDESVGCAGFEEKQPEGERNFRFSEVLTSVAWPEPGSSGGRRLAIDQYPVFLKV